MEEWEYEPCEFYIVFCADDEYSDEGIVIFTVMNDENDFLWCAFLIDEYTDENTDWDEIFEIQ